ncbi:MAG: betaine-aldehyde dehydrogenase, partial [Planctomycetota bacterium]
MTTNDSKRSGGSKAGKAGGAARDLPFGGVWPYAPAPEATDVAPIPARQELFVGGAWTKPKSGRYFATTNPATEA